MALSALSGKIPRLKLRANSDLAYSKFMVPEIQLDETEATLLARAFDADRGDLPREAAEILLKARFPASDLKRMQDLGELA